MRSIRSMAPVTDLTAADDAATRLHWSGRLSLTTRILAVNIVAILLLAGSFFYLDGFRKRIIDERMDRAQAEARLTGITLASAAPRDRGRLVAAIGASTGSRVRLLDGQGVLLADSWTSRPPSFELRDPSEEPWQRHAARWIDDAIDTIVDAKLPPTFTGFAVPPDLCTASPRLTLAPDRTHVITAADCGAIPGTMVVVDKNARDIRRLVRAERTRLGIVIGVIALLSILLSFFLARTIARPLRRLADAATRVRLGRAREVVVPRLPSRQDEIGELARALSDMSQTLRERIDASEAFAGDVSHELKNPIASLSSAIEGLQSVKQPELRAKLMTIMAEDVRRLDRLVTDIAELSRLDAQLTKTRFERLDMGTLLETIVKARDARAMDGSVKIAFARPQKGSCLVSGDAARLARVVDSLIDNAVSFSPPDGVVRVSATCAGDIVRLSVEDEGSGIPPGSREAIFERFHSDRPDTDFGRHSGLGLAIARTIVEGHDGSIEALESPPGGRGAHFVVNLPAAR